PFSPESPMKIFFVQRVDLDLGKVESSLLGLPGFVEDVLAEVPSSVGQRVDCRDGIDAGRSWTGRDGLRSCVWEGLWPDVVAQHAMTSAQTAQEARREETGSGRSPSSDLAPYTNDTKETPPHHPDASFESWLDYNISLTSPHSASLTFQGRNTKQYRLSFPPHQPPPSSLKIHNGNLSSSVEDPRFGPPLGPSSSSSSSSPTFLRIIPRTWDARIRVDISWPADKDGVESVAGFRGEVMALWSDANQPGTIPGFDEVRRFAPRWSSVTKGDDGLVLGVRGWEVPSSSEEEEASAFAEEE
ncbi:hypothetical protein KC336_g18534, partial [Hortaea werneckii]